MVKRRSEKVLSQGLKALGILMAIAVPSTSKAALLFYNGDYDLNNATVNESKVPVNFGGTATFETFLAYDDFIVPVGQTWTITNLFTNDQVSYYTAPTKATWQIRSGMSAGNGGTLLYSGDSTAVITAGHAADGINYPDPEKNVSVAVSGITLTAGVYYMAVAPDSNGYEGDQSYIETTSGANAVGLPTGIDGNSYLNNTLTGTGKTTFAYSSLDYSAGIMGTAVILPEPASLSLVALGAVSLLGRRRKLASIVAGK